MEVQKTEIDEMQSASETKRNIFLHGWRTDVDAAVAALSVEANADAVLNFLTNNYWEEKNRKRPRQRQEAVNYWSTSWGKLLRHPEVKDVATKTGRLFRRRFRVPFSIFEFIVQK
jgi:hypothetical protein